MNPLEVLGIVVVAVCLSLYFGVFVGTLWMMWRDWDGWRADYHR